MFKILTVVQLILCFSFSSFANQSIKILRLNPALLEQGQIMNRGLHEVMWKEGTPSQFLLVTLGGTNSLPEDMRNISQTALTLGYRTIGLDYNNSVISTTCAKSTNPLCFELFRKAVTEGKPGTDLLDIDEINSLESRLKSVLAHMVQLDPMSWGLFYNPKTGKIQWNQIVVIGHSQGSGHAAYLAKNHPLKAVIMLAGPQDHFSNSPDPVSWLTFESQTPPSAYFALLHKKDFFNSNLQLQAVSVLRHEFNDTSFLNVNLEAPPEKGHRVLISDADARDGHMAVIQASFKKLWRYLLSEAID